MPVLRYIGITVVLIVVQPTVFAGTNAIAVNEPSLLGLLAVGAVVSILFYRGRR